MTAGGRSAPRERDVGERRAVEPGEQGLASVREDVVDGTPSVRPARTAAEDAEGWPVVAFDGADHLEQRDRLGCARKPVAPRPAGGARDEPGSREVAEDVREKSLGDRHPLGEAPRAERRVTVVERRQGEHRADGIVAAPGQFKAHRRAGYLPAPDLRPAGGAEKHATDSRKPQGGGFSDAFDAAGGCGRTMTSSALRGSGGVTSHAPETIAIGDPDVAIFGCPGCARPLVVGSRRCPGCRTWLVLGTPLRRAGAFVALGASVGMLTGIVLGSGVVTGALPPLVVPGQAAAPVTTPVVSPAPASAAPVATLAPAMPPMTAPTGMLSALDQTAVMNSRIVAVVPALQAALASTSLDTPAVVRALRSLAADTSYGVEVAKRLEGWDRAALLAGDLGAFYAEVRASARDALAASVANEAAYRRAAERMLGTLGGVGALDALSRTLAAEFGGSLPPVDLSLLEPAMP